MPETLYEVIIEISDGVGNWETLEYNWPLWKINKWLNVQGTSNATVYTDGVGDKTVQTYEHDRWRLSYIY